MNNKELDWNNIQKKLMRLVTNLLSNKVSYRTVQLEVELPAEVVEIFEEIADYEGVKIDTLLGEYASTGIIEQLQGQIQESLGSIGLGNSSQKGGNPTIPDIPDSKTFFSQMGLDTSDIENNMKKLKETIDQLQEIAKPFENIEE